MGIIFVEIADQVVGPPSPQSTICKMFAQIISILVSRNEGYAIILKDFKRKIRTWNEIQYSDFQMSSLALCHFSYPGSIDSLGINISLESNDNARRFTRHEL